MKQPVKILKEPVTREPVTTTKVYLGDAVYCEPEGDLLGKDTIKNLPPDPEEMNDERAGWAQVAISEFRLVTHCDLGDAVSDLIADLMHWCDRHDISFSEELERARVHYAEETEEWETGDEPSSRLRTASR